MAGFAAARPVTPSIVTERAGRFELGLATAGDFANIRSLLEEPLGGEIAVSLEREPDSRIAAAIEGDVHQTLVARDRASNRIAAIASRSVRTAFVNGRPARLGYLGQLRIARGFRHSRALLDEGFAFCRQLHLAGDARAYLVSMVAENRAARRLLLGTRSRCAPRFKPAGALSTLVVPRRSSPIGRASAWTRELVRFRAPEGIEIHGGSRELLDEIVACLWRHGERHQFAPCWSVEDLCSPHRTPDLAPEHFLVATRRGRLVGCVACWDQRRFKRVMVRAYSTRLRRWRPAVNLLAPWLGMPRLPHVGRRLELAYLSHLAVDDDDAGTAAALIEAARIRVAANVDYIVTGLASGSPLQPALRRRFAHREYSSELYLACWADGESFVNDLDGRRPQPEVAVL